MDKFVVRYKTSDEALPLVWKTSPLPKSKPKRPVGRPHKGKLECEDANFSAKRLCTENLSQNSNDVDSLTDMCSENQPHDSVTQSVCLENQSPVTNENDANIPEIRSTDTCEKSENQSQNSSASSENSANDHLSGAAVSSFRGNYKHFTIKQKLEVLEFSKLYGVRAAARHFKIPKSSVSNWSKTDFTCVIRDKKGSLPKTGRPLTYPEELDQKILEYVLEQRDLQNAVSIEDICIYAAEIIQPVSPGFAASRRWAIAFMKRHDLSLRAKTSLSQRLPHDLEDKLSSFHTFVKSKREENEFDDNMIINMDETPVYFDLQPSKTINKCGEKSVLIRTTGSEKRHFTVVLAVAASGDMLPPMIIFKGKRDLNMSVPPGWIVTVQEKGWMDESLMLRWIRDLYLKYTKKDRSLLVMDSFRGHLTENVKKAFRKGNTVTAIIPGGCTSKLQPLDVSINKPFKTELRRSWGRYMRESAKTARDRGERVKAASKETVIGWLVSAFKTIQTKPSMIMYSFLVCGISNKLDGSQDNFIRSELCTLNKDSAEVQSESPETHEVDSDCDEFEGFDVEDIVGSLDDLRE